MILVSHHLYFTTPVRFPKEKIVLRINVAWMKNKRELLSILRTLEHDIYLDYPQGRTKPPRPTLTLEEAIEIAHAFPAIKYFAVSNVEEPEKIYAIKKRLPASIEVVPKIETEKGVKNMPGIIDRLDTKHVMLDKEDLYVDVGKDSKRFEKLVETARQKAQQAHIELLELHGVVFLPYQKRRT